MSVVHSRTPKSPYHFTITWLNAFIMHPYYLNERIQLLKKDLSQSFVSRACWGPLLLLEGYIQNVPFHFSFDLQFYAQKKGKMYFFFKYAIANSKTASWEQYVKDVCLMDISAWIVLCVDSCMLEIKVSWRTGLLLFYFATGESMQTARFLSDGIPFCVVSLFRPNFS